MHGLVLDEEGIREKEEIKNADLDVDQPSTVKNKDNRNRIDMLDMGGDILDQFQEPQTTRDRKDSDDEFEFQREVPEEKIVKDVCEDIANTDFWIPKMPMGKNIEFHILSTWGDNYYVGLSGIEIFNNEGNLIPIESHEIVASPPDINILPGYGNDPRTIDKLVDGN
jgi:hypothetical protein